MNDFADEIFIKDEAYVQKIDDSEEINVSSICHF